MNEDEMKPVIDVTKLDVIEIIKYALTSSMPKGPDPADPLLPGEKVLGTVTSPSALGLYHAYQETAKHVNRIADEHNALHADNVKCNSEKCDETVKAYYRFNNRATFLLDLAYQAVCEEHPCCMHRKMLMRQGWKMVDVETSFVPATLVKHPDSIIGRIIPRLREISQGINLCVDEDTLGPIGAGERVIGTVDDERIQCLSGFVDTVARAYEREMPAPFLDDDTDAAVQFAKSIPEEELKAYETLSGHFHHVTKALNGILWCSIRDILERQEGELVPYAGIRRSWEIVSLPPRSSGLIPLIMLVPPKPGE